MLKACFIAPLFFSVCLWFVSQEGDDEEEEDADDFLDYSDEAAQAARLAAQAAEARRAGGRDDRGGASQQRRGGAGHLENAIDSLARRYQDQTFEEGEEEEDDLLEDADGYPCKDDSQSTYESFSHRIART